MRTRSSPCRWVFSASFQFGGAKRRDPMRKLPLRHGDVVVWGNKSRLAYHGIAELKDGRHPLLGALRINLTFAARYKKIWRASDTRRDRPDIDQPRRSGWP